MHSAAATSSSPDGLGSRAVGGTMSVTSPSAAHSSRNTSPVHCIHPECIAMAPDNERPRCRKVQNQNQSQGQSQSQSQNQNQDQNQFQYTRPRHVKLQCDQCTDYPEGFRSEHELRRHTNRVHREVRKVWITVDASPEKNFLSNCKSCTSGKRYNECYNAASHLRRMHFHPRKRGEGKNEKRGGAGSIRSEDPPMEVLKSSWLREVEEAIGDDGSKDRSEDEDRMDVDDMSPDS